MVIHDLYRDLIVEHEKDVNFWIFFTFLPTFIIARLVAHTIPDVVVTVGQVHIHHLTWGIFILAASGFWSFHVKTRRARAILAAIYGIGLALAFDEFGLWLRLEDNYWVRQSYDAIISITVFLVNIVYFFHFWKHLILHYLLRKKYL